MHDILRQHITAAFGGKEPPGLTAVLDCFQARRLKRGTLLLAQGDVCRHCYFVASGVVQVFSYDQQANEVTRDIVTEQGWVTEIESFSRQQAARENLRAVEPTQVLAIGADSFRQLMAEVPPFEQMYRQIIERSYTNSVYRLNTFIGMDAAGRLAWLAEHQPKMMQRLSSRLLASYLGISPETYSRLKAKR